jgi:tricorn protease-like protein
MANKQIEDFYEDFVKAVNSFEGNIYRIENARNFPDGTKVAFIGLQDARQIKESHLFDLLDLRTGEVKPTYLMPMNCYPRLKRVSFRKLTTRQAHIYANFFCDQKEF